MTSLRPIAAVAFAILAAACSRQPAGGTGPAAAASGSGLGPLHALELQAAAGSAEPHLAARAGQVVLSWVEAAGDGQALTYARLDGDRWSAPVVAARGDNWVVTAADIPAVEPVTDRLWAAHWRVAQAASPYGYDIAIAISADAGATWSAPRLLNDDGKPAEHGFVSVFQWGDGIGALWLDGRNAEEEEEEPAAAAPETPAAAPAPADGAGSATRAGGPADLPPGTELRYARLGADASLLEQGVIDELVCDCCKTDVAHASDGWLVVYRDRTPDEIRDIFVRRQTADGWSEPVSVGTDRWRIEGCPVNGPAIAASGSSVAVAWFTAAGGRPQVRLARSHDSGATFEPPVEIDGAGAVGHVGVALLQDDSALVSWWRRSAAGAELGTRRVSAGGEAGPVRSIGTTSAARPEDVPQIARSGSRLIAAWTERGDVTRVKSAFAEVGALR